jgi:hypothetical protein
MCLLKLIEYIVDTQKTTQNIITNIILVRIPYPISDEGWHNYL